MIANKFSVMFIVVIALTTIVSGQRSPYAGSRPQSGYKDRFQPAQTVNANEIGNRVGDVSTERLPYDAYGDAFIVQHSNQLPINNRPFWLLNQAHIEAQRGTPTNAASGSLAPQIALTAANATALDNNANRNNNNNINVADRFAANNNLNTLQDNTNYDPNIITQPQIVYPESISPEQRQQMQAFYDQQRMQAIAQQQQQLLNRGQNQQNLNQNQQNPNQNQQQQTLQPTLNQQQPLQSTLNQQPQLAQSLNQQQIQPQSLNQQQIQQQQQTQQQNQQPIFQQPNPQPQLASNQNFLAPNFEQRFPQVPIFPQLPRPDFPAPPQFPRGSFQRQPQHSHPDSLVVAPYFVDYDS